MSETEDERLKAQQARALDHVEGFGEALRALRQRRLKGPSALEALVPQGERPAEAEEQEDWEGLLRSERAEAGALCLLMAASLSMDPHVPTQVQGDALWLLEQVGLRASEIFPKPHGGMTPEEVQAYSDAHHDRLKDMAGKLLEQAQG